MALKTEKAVAGAALMLFGERSARVIDETRARILWRDRTRSLETPVAAAADLTRLTRRLSHRPSPTLRTYCPIAHPMPIAREIPAGVADRSDRNGSATASNQPAEPTPRPEVITHIDTLMSTQVR